MIVGTAGHVDHGKTSLVKALTGIDTDRLPEEKRRGITLELGFAHLVLPSGRTVGVIDVPGHERFVKAMAAGAGGIDIAILVVAADEGVMPQTREHLDILGLLGVRRGVLVVTKSDLLPGLGAGWLELLETDLRSLTAGTFLEGAAIIPVSARRREGLEVLVAELTALAEGALVPAPSALGSPARTAWSLCPQGPLFLPIDRAFISRGFGAIVTGTLLAGRVSVADAVSLLPGLAGPFRLRGLQVHGRSVESVAAGERVALNISDVELSALRRGMVISRAGELEEARVLDVEVTLLASAVPLPRRSHRLVTVGTAQREAWLHLLDSETLRPGQTALAQLVVSSPVAALPGQRFVLRAPAGPQATIGGGRVLALNPRRRRRGTAADLRAFAEAALSSRLLFLLAEAGHRGLSEAALFARTAAPARAVTEALETATARGEVVLVDREARRFLSGSVFAALVSRAISLLEQFHQAAPDQEGMSRAELRQRLSGPDERVFHVLIETLVREQRAEVLGERLRLLGQGQHFDVQTESLRGRVVALLAHSGLSPPTVTEVSARLRVEGPGVSEVLNSLVKAGELIRAGDLFFSASHVRDLEARLRSFLAGKQRITTSEFKELTGQSRKYAIPLAEYFDRERVTLRVGDARVARRSG